MAPPLVLSLSVQKTTDGRLLEPVRRRLQVDVWQANYQGIYSDEAAEGTVGKKFLRGYQVTDENGTVQFTTVYPGWYSGRTVHIHFRIRTHLTAPRRPSSSLRSCSSKIPSRTGSCPRLPTAPGGCLIRRTPRTASTPERPPTAASKVASGPCSCSPSKKPRMVTSGLSTWEPSDLRRPGGTTAASTIRENGAAPRL